MLENYREEIEELKRQLKQAKGDEQHSTGTGSTSKETRTSPSLPVDTNDEDAIVLSQAISNLERLILKTSTAEEKKRRLKRKERIAARRAENNDGIFDIPDDLNDNSLLNLLDERTVDGDDDLMSLNSKDRFTNDTSHLDDSTSLGSVSFGDESTIVEGKKLVTELHRIRGLLGNVLERKGTAGGIQSPGITPIKFSNSSSNNGQEVERLRAQLHEQAVTTSLRKADSSFLQSQLQEKDKLLNDVSHVLEAVENRQVELEGENERLKQEYSRSIAALKSKESEVMIMEKLMKKREKEIKKLKQGK